MSNNGFIQITPRSRPAGLGLSPGPSTVSSPYVPQIHLFEVQDRPHLLLANGSQIFEIEEGIYADLDRARKGRDHRQIDSLLEGLGLETAPFVNDGPPTAFPVRALSLSVAQKCNLGCTYCYAQEGTFGETPQNMTAEAAVGSLDLLFDGARDGEKVNLSFLGGEPLINRKLIREITLEAARRAAALGVRIGFSITTNGTLLNAGDAGFFEEHGFAVTISLDGIGKDHDRLRPFKNGAQSYGRIISNVRPLLEKQRKMQVTARVTVTPQNLNLIETLDTLIEMGFHSVGFSPMLSSPTGRGEMDTSALETMLSQMIACGEKFEQRLREGVRYPFSNMTNALREIHKGTHRPYPCGAGAGYMGVSADGDLFACHRFVGDEAGRMGDVSSGVDPAAQQDWLASRHVHTQEPCKSCWARYLCGGGCHHEVINRGRPACDYIRGWLHYCLQAYIRALSLVPDYFGADGI